MIQAKGLSVEFGKEVVLKNVSIDIVRNSTCAIIGPTGCGKTTLLYTLAGLIIPQRGQVIINQEELKGIRKETGIIHQNSGLLPWKTVWENVTLGLKARKVGKVIIAEKAASILDELGMKEHIDKFPAQLSGGQKQRVAIARTLVTEPDILLLDEASSALDAITKEHIQNLILRIYKKDPTTLVMVTHSIEEAVFLGQRIVVMKDGVIRKIIDNPFFGDENIRTKSVYYNMCLEVRKQLSEGEER